MIYFKVSECSSPRVRGALGSFTAMFLSFGIFLAYIIGALVQWHVFCFILGSIPILTGLAMVVLSIEIILCHLRKKILYIRFVCQRLHHGCCLVTWSLKLELHSNIFVASNTRKYGIINTTQIVKTLIVIYEIM